MLRLLGALSAVLFQFAPASAQQTVTYEACISDLNQWNQVLEQALEISTRLSKESRRAYPPGANDDDPGLVYFQAMKPLPEEIVRFWRPTQKALSSYCRSLLE